MNMTARKFVGYEDELHDAARRGAGLEDFGDPAYRDGLRALLSAYDTDLPPTESIRRAAYRFILSILIARLYTQKGWAEYPDVLKIPIQRPLMITGLPRTGTTALHKLLSVDSQFQGVEFWLIGTPMIRPPRDTWEAHHEYRACIAKLGGADTIASRSRKAHDFVAGEVEDCDGFLAQSFVMDYVFSRGLLPTYSRWCSRQSLQEPYRRYANVLRLIGGRDPHKTWLLKSPPRMAEIDALLEVFPDACIIQTHRDPLLTIPSHCNLLNMWWQGVYGEVAPPDIIGPLECAFWRKALDRIQSVRRKFPLQFFDIDHRRFLADPMNTIRSVYEYFGLSLSPDVERQMHAWIAVSPTSKHGSHQYRLDSWGVTQAQIAETFAEYRAQHQFR